MWYGTMGWGWIFWIVLVVAIVWLLAYVLKGQRSTEGSHGDRALEVLKERFARGEISEEEYEKKRKILRE